MSVPFSVRSTSRAVARRAGPLASSASLRALGRRLRASSVPREDLAGAQQHTARLALGTAHQVEAEPHPVDEVHVRVTRRAEHRGVALGTPPEGVRAGVGLSRVRLDLGDAQDDAALVARTDEVAAEQFGGDLQDGAVEEGAARGVCGCRRSFAYGLGQRSCRPRVTEPEVCVRPCWSDHPCRGGTTGRRWA